MSLSVTPARGRWYSALLAVDSSATFVKGSIVKLNGARDVVEMTSLVTDTHLLGVAAHGSADSMPSGYVIVYIPTPGATAYAPTGGTAQSSLSVGQGVSFTKSGNTFSLISSSMVTRHAVVVGPLRSQTTSSSAASTIEVSFLADALQYFSTTTNAI